MQTEPLNDLAHSTLPHPILQIFTLDTSSNMEAPRAKIHNPLLEIDDLKWDRGNEFYSRIEKFATSINESFARVTDLNQTSAQKLKQLKSLVKDMELKFCAERLFPALAACAPPLKASIVPGGRLSSWLEISVPLQHGFWQELTARSITMLYRFEIMKQRLKHKVSHGSSARKHPLSEQL